MDIGLRGSGRAWGREGGGWPFVRKGELLNVRGRMGRVMCKLSVGPNRQQAPLSSQITH